MVAFGLEMPSCTVDLCDPVAANSPEAYPARLFPRAEPPTRALRSTRSPRARLSSRASPSSSLDVTRLTAAR